MPSDHPFQLLFETFGKLPENHSEEVNRQEREELRDWLEVPLEDPGHSILLKAPRAGHGKTHLLTHLQHELGGSHEFVALHALGGSRIDAATVLDDILRRLVRTLPAAAGLSVLDLVARRLFSSSLQPLVNSGEVPCQDREGALGALRNRPIETFDFHHPGAVTAHWARENFELLGPRLALALSQQNGLPLREISFWVDALFRFAATPVDNLGRVRALSATVFDDPSAEAVAHERLVALLGLLTSLMRVVLVADELEGFSSDETAALRFASFLGSLRQSVDRVDVILSINQDVWESAFLPRLSGGLADRLSEVVVELEPLDRQGMIAVLESRSPGFGEKILDQIDAAAIETHARGLMREAGHTWERAAAEKSAQEEENTPKESSPNQPSAGEDNEAGDVKRPEQETGGQQVEKPSAGSAPQSPPAMAPTGPEPAWKATPTEPAGLAPASPSPDTFSAEAAIAAFANINDPVPEPISTDAAAGFAPPSEGFSQPAAWPAPEATGAGYHSPERPPAPAPAQHPQPPLNQQNDPVQSAPPPKEDQGPAADRPPAPEEVRPVSQPAPQAAQNQQHRPAGSSDSSTDRVDDLLRQFRERYGKSSS